MILGWRTKISVARLRIVVEDTVWTIEGEFLACRDLCRLRCPFQPPFHEKCNGRISGKREAERMLGEVYINWTTSFPKKMLSHLLNRKTNREVFRELLGWGQLPESFKKGICWNPPVLLQQVHLTDVRTTLHLCKPPKTKTWKRGERNLEKYHLELPAFFPRS